MQSGDKLMIAGFSLVLISVLVTCAKTAIDNELKKTQERMVCFPYEVVHGYDEGDHHYAVCSSGPGGNPEVRMAK